MTSSISWQLLPFEETEQSDQLVPFVDGRSLAERIAEFEQQQGYEPAGGYAGRTPAHRRHDLDRALSGEQSSDHRVALLGCACGDLGCWPLEATVSLSEGEIRWSEFTQPHRPDRDYSGFGPFVFDAAEYRHAVAGATGASSTRTS